MLYIIQIKDATDLISKNDATIIGVLLFVIVLMSTGMGFLWRAYRDDQKYIKEQDKANLEMLKDVTHAVQDVSSDTKDTKTEIAALKLSSQRLLDIVSDRLKYICKNGSN